MALVGVVLFAADFLPFVFVRRKEDVGLGGNVIDFCEA
jgi:hypothetical protein